MLARIETGLGELYWSLRVFYVFLSCTHKEKYPELIYLMSAWNKSTLFNDIKLLSHAIDTIAFYYLLYANHE